MKKIAVGIFLLIVGGYVFYKLKPKGETAQKLKIYKEAIKSKPLTYDPLISVDMVSIVEAARIYDSLLVYTYMKERPVLEPSLLEEMPKVSEDKKTISCKLKQGILFSKDKCFKNKEERELTSEDVEYCFKRATDPSFKGVVYHFIDSKIVGIDKWRKDVIRDPSNFDKKIEGFKIIDKYNFEIHLVEPYSEIFNVLAHVNFFILSKKACKYYKEDIGKHPVGTGPFILEKDYNSLDNTIVYLKNPDYRTRYFSENVDPKYKHVYEKYKNQKLPFVDKIVVEVVQEASTRALKLLNGELDLIEMTFDPNISEYINSDLSLKENYKQKGLDLFVYEKGGTEYVLFNNTNKALKDLRVRKAITSIIDRNEYIKLFTHNTYSVAQGNIPPGILGYDKEFRNKLYLSNCSTEDEKQNLIQNAKRLLKEAGYPNGEGMPELVIECSSTTEYRQKAEFIKKQLAKIGIKVKVNTNTWAEVLKKSHDKNFDMLLISWHVESPDGIEISSLYYGGNIESGHNLAVFKDERFDAYFDKLQFIYDNEERIKYLKEANKHLSSVAPVVFLSHPKSFFLHSNRVKNLFSNSFTYDKALYIDIKE